MIESVKVLGFVVYHACLFLVAVFVAATIAQFVFRRLNARRDKRNLARNGKGITITFQGQTITIATRLPDGFPGCETCAMEGGVATPRDPDGEITASFQCPRHYDLFADHLRAAWARRQDEARRDA